MTVIKFGVVAGEATLTLESNLKVRSSYCNIKKQKNNNNKKTKKMYGNRINCQEEDEEMTLGELMARNFKEETFEEYKMSLIHELNS